MSIRTVIKIGRPQLLTVAEDVVSFNTPELHALIEDMRDTMQALSGAGLAAPQIDVGLRVVIFGIEKNPRYPDMEPVPQTVLINPVIEPIGNDMDEMWEGCLSVPGMRGLVPRYTNIRYRGFDQAGEAIEREVSGFHARVVQHEVDHLDGVLYPQRIKDMRMFGFEDELFPEKQDSDEDSLLDDG